ncbi:MAG: septum formation initiator family protein [Melioribacteraceae bacterium]|nr:septum formation initiator family protein [Melioribacteraceae bacterium]
MTKRKRKFIFYTFVVVIVVGTIYIIFNEYGALKYMKLKNEVDSMRFVIEKTKLENEQLKSEIDSLQKKIPAKMEQIAREKYNMKREGEIAIEVEEE